MKAHPTTESRVNSLLKTKQSRASVSSRSRVMKFLNEYFFGFSEEELEAYGKSKEPKKGLDQLGY